MTQLIGEAGDEHTMMTVGLGVVGSTYSFGSSYGLLDATPLAQLMSEPEGILVPADSPYETVDGLRRGVEGRPRLVRHRRRLVAGRPRPPLPDAAGRRGRHRPERRQLRVVRRRRPAHQRAARRRRSTPASRARRSSPGQIEDGDLRMLAVSGEERSPQDAFADVPTLTESGIDLVFLNWRGVLAPPDISEERRDELIGYLEEMHDTDGVAASAGGRTAGPTTSRPATTSTTFIEEQDDRVSGHPRGAGADLMTDDGRPTATEPVRIDKAQYGLAAVLAVVGDLHDRRRARAQRRLRRPGRAARVPLRHRHA